MKEYRQICTQTDGQTKTYAGSVIA